MLPEPLNTSPYTHHVYVDYENVPELSLDLLEGKPARVTLLIGKNQAKLEYGVVEQIHRFAAQVCLVKLGVAGRNALDLSLAFYLGKTVQAHPGLHHCVLSKDKDYDAMIAHLRATGVEVSRHESFESLPFLPRQRKAAAPRPPSATKAPAHSKVAATAVPVPSAAPTQVDDTEGAARFEKLVHLLRGNSAPKPKTKARLLAFIFTVFGQKLNDVDQSLKLAELEKRGVVSVDGKGKVTYAKHT